LKPSSVMYCYLLLVSLTTIENILKPSTQNIHQFTQSTEASFHHPMPHQLVALSLSATVTHHN
jgi:hypothetical protein